MVQLSRRLAGISGVVFVVLSVAILATAPPPPTLTSSAAEIVTYYADHQGGFLLGNYLGALALVPAFVVLVYLAVTIRDAEAGRGSLWVLAITTSATALGVTIVLFALLQAAAVVAPAGPPSTAKAVSDVANVTFGFFFVPMGAAVGAIAWGFLATRTMPVWIGWSGIVVALLQLVGSLGTVVITGPLAAGGIVTLVAFSALIAWFLVISVILLVRPLPQTA